MTAPHPKQLPDRRRRTGLIAAITVAGLVLVGGVVWGASSLFRPGGALASPVGPDVTQVDLPRDEQQLTLALGFEPSALAREMNGDEQDFSGIVEVFSDPELTRRVDVIASARGETLTLTETGTRQLEGPGGAGSAREVGDGNEGWTFYERYYVARLVDAEGVGLAEPLVTEIVAEPRLDSVTPEFSTDTTEGTLEIAWQPVADASEYLVVLSTWHPEQQFRVYRVLGSSEDTAWSSAELADPEENPREQNSGMQLFTGPSEDLEAGADHRPVEGVELGVLAVNGPTVSAYAPLPAPAFLGDLPYEVATKTMQATYPKDLASLPLSDFPTGFPVTTLAGDLRNTAMRIDPDSIEETEIVTGDTNNPSFEPGFAFRATGVGTTLESPRLVIRGTDRAALDREIAEYNERALRDPP